MVLQQGMKIPVWGWAAPGEQVTVSIAGQELNSTADKNGLWQVILDPLKADGKPLTMTVTGRSTLAVQDVLVGEVWLCGGQSNMAMGVGSCLDAKDEIAAANLPQVRMYNSVLPPSPVPLKESPSNWTACSPDTVSGWPAAGFFFARYLHKQLNVPVGIINTSMGGMPIQTYMSIERLRQLPTAKAEVEAHVALLQKYLVHRAQRDKEITDAHQKQRERTQWLQAQDKREENPAASADPKADLSTWETVALPVAKDKVIFPQSGIYWLRREIEFPKTWLGRELVVAGVEISQCDQVYLDGRQIPGGAWVENYDYTGGRTYVLPADQVKDTKLTLAIRILDIGGRPCFNSGDINPIVGLTKPGADERPILIHGPWRMRQAVKIEAKDLPVVPTVEQPPGRAAHHPEAMYNSCIAPLAGYGLRGAIWYQGEADAARPEYYQQALPALAADWRNRWSQGDFAFGVVQLPNFMGRQSLAVESGWADFREAQCRGVRAMKNAGLAVTIDIGEAGDVHPKNKQEVGRRLGLWAMATIYGKTGIVWSGPVFKSMKTQNGKLVVEWDSVGGGLVAKGGPLMGFAVAGNDKVFHLAQAMIEGDRVVAGSNQVRQPVALRYAWANNPVCNLFNKEGLPAMPFRTDDWPGKDVKAAADEKIPPEDAKPQ